MSDKPDTKLAISDFNLQSISTTEYADVLSGTIQSGANLAIFGRRGSGKTEIAKQVIASTDISEDQSNTRAKEIYINLSVSERTDMGGYPDMYGIMHRDLSQEDKKEIFVNFVLPAFFKPLIVGHQPCVVLLDEVDKADPSIWAPLLEILQFKSINHRPLPNLRSCIMTGNLISEGSQRPSLPLLDRAEKYLLQADTSAFLAWAARTNKIHPSVVAFLTDKMHQLYGSNDGAGDLYAEQSPRGWENASKALFFGEKNNWPKEIMNLKVSGFVGKQAGLEYQIYFEHYRELLPLINAIFNGEDVAAKYKDLNPSMQIYAAMIMCSRLAGILDRVPVEEGAPVDKPKELGYIGRFLQKAVTEENILVAVRTQLTLNRLILWGLDSNKDWKEILTQVTTHVDNA